MKITKSQLKQIIKEELNGVLNEDWAAAEERAYDDIKNLKLDVPPLGSMLERYIISNMKHLYIKNPAPPGRNQSSL